MNKWICTVCGYIYDPRWAIPTTASPPGTAFWRIFRKTMFARSAAWARMPLKQKRNPISSSKGALVVPLCFFYLVQIRLSSTPH